MSFKNFTGNDNNDGNGGGGNGGIPTGIGGFPQMSASPDTDAPEDVLINYNERFQTGADAMFRENVIKQIFSALVSKNKPNAILVGPAGTGKTRIIEDIAYRLVSKNPTVPDKISDMIIYELPLNSLTAGTAYRGQLEQKIKDIVTFAEDPANKAILFIDEIHQLADEKHPSHQQIAQALKPALARGNIKVIGATTTQEMKNLLSDPAFNRRFTKIIVDELTKEQTVEILKTVRGGIIQHHNNRVTVADDILTTVVRLADTYRTAGSHRPDNAITLLDRAAADAIVRRKYDEYNLRNNPQMLNALKSVPLIPVTETQIRQTAIRLATGNSKPEKLDVDSLKQRMSAIKGQDHIVEQLVTELRKHEMNLIPSNQPLALLFAGPSGVGKTEITKIIAKELTGCPPIILNMTEYHSSASINRIIGAPPGYVGSDSNMELPFDALESNPYQIILLDEFEKCDSAVQRLFMSVLDEGKLKTNRGDEIDFSRAIIIATTNAGHQVTRTKMGFGTNSVSSHRTQIKELSQWFDAALLNRFRDQITFNEINEDIYREILESKYADMLSTIKDNNPSVNLPDAIPDDKLEQIIKDTYVPEFGARPAATAVENYIYGELI